MMWYPGEMFKWTGALEGPLLSSPPPFCPSCLKFILSVLPHRVPHMAQTKFPSRYLCKKERLFSIYSGKNIFSIKLLKMFTRVLYSSI
jgi:hypothetical protein